MNEIHVCRGTGRKFIALVRGRGERKWHRIGKPRDTCESAALAITKTLFTVQWAHFGEVRMIADWYEPTTVWEAKR